MNKLLSKRWCFFLLAITLPASFVYAADHPVSSGTSTVDCATYNGGVRPGDTITLAAGERGALTVRNCKGTTNQRIVVRNDATGNGPTVIQRSSASSGGFVFTCGDCEHVVIDGTAKWRGAPESAYCGAPAGRDGCGIRLTLMAPGDDPSAFLMLTGLTTKMTIRGVEVDGRFSAFGTGRSGMVLNDHTKPASDHPGMWREEFIYENNYVHHVGNSGFYLGPNWADDGIRLRNVVVRNNLIENTGRDGIKLKSAIEGENRIHHNIIRQTGLKNETGKFGAGISISDGGHSVRTYNNWIEGAGVQGILHYNIAIPSSYGPFESAVYNNVVFDSGKRGGASAGGHGIVIGGNDGTALIKPEVFNNTVVKAARTGILFNKNAQGGVARDNIVSDWGSEALLLSGNADLNNFSGSSASVLFVSVDGLNFELKSDSPARDAGSRTGFAPVDYRGVARPQGEGADQGAFEYSVSLPPPRAPSIMEVD